MLPPVSYKRANNLDEVLFFLSSKKDIKLLAGGTDLVIEMRKSRTPYNIVDISKLGELRFIREEGNKIRIGALTTHSEISQSSIVRSKAKPLALASASVGSPSIRNLGTIGGNIVNASPAADTLPALALLNANLILASIDGKRTLSISDFIKGAYKTDIQPGEILIEIEIDSLSPNTFSYFVKLGRRNALAIARLSVAVALNVADSRITEARIAPGAVFRSPHRVKPAEDYLIGKKPSVESFAEAGKMVSAEMIKTTGIRWSTPYKEPVLAALVRRALMLSLGWEVK